MLNNVSIPAGSLSSSIPEGTSKFYDSIIRRHTKTYHSVTQGHLWQHGSLVILNYSLVPSFPVLSMVKYHPNYCSRKFVTLGKKKRWLEANETNFNQHIRNFSIPPIPQKIPLEETVFSPKFHLKKMTWNSYIKSPPPPHIFSGHERSPSLRSLS